MYSGNGDMLKKTLDEYKEKIILPVDIITNNKEVKLFVINEENYDFIIQDIIKKINADKSKILVHINNDLVLIKEYGRVNLVPKSVMPSDFYLKIEKDGIYQLPDNKEIVVDKNICYLKHGKFF